MQRGDIVYANLAPSLDSEADKLRPVIVVSNNIINRTTVKNQRGVITIVPLTTNVRRVLSFQVFLPADVTGLQYDSKAQAEQIRSIAYERFLPDILGHVPSSYMLQLENALKRHLEFE
ncbi:MAG: type II toxin-antitoxin system PemK/MazF family toxin [Deinococcota bacterium]